MTNHSATCTVDVSSLQVLKNYPTNKALRSWYTTALSTHRTSTATYRASKWGFPAIEYKPLGASSTGLLGRWEMLGNANDTSGNARNMSLTAAPGLTTGRWADANSAYLLDGTSQYLSTPTITDLNVS